MSITIKRIKQPLHVLIGLKPNMALFDLLRDISRHVFCNTNTT